MASFFILALVGPTASGKTQISLDLAENLNTSIISVDSMQVYRGMDIGTAKPSPEERRGIPHYGLDLSDPTQPFSVADYCASIYPVLAEHYERGQPVIASGGTGLYFKGLFEGLADAPPPDFEFRARMEAFANSEGTVDLFSQLAAIDAEAALKIHPNDRKRIIRALEIHHVSGMNKTSFEGMQRPPAWAGRVAWFGLRRDFGELDERIDARVDEMLAQGLVDEVKGLLGQGCTRAHTSMQALGYKEIADHLEGQFPLDQAVEKIRQRTHRYARRQMTWFRPNPLIQWLDAGPQTSHGEILGRILSATSACAARSGKSWPWTKGRAAE